MSAPTVAIATNNGDIGGGEVMLLSIAEAIRALGIDVAVLGPSEPRDLLIKSASRGFVTIPLPARSRPQYMAALRMWRLAHPRVPLWCNGLVPSVATAGFPHRLVHLHRLPTGLQTAAAAAARAGARELLVPSRFMAGHVRHARVLENWTEEIPYRHRRRSESGPLRVGFMGRLTRDKGMVVLAHAMREVISRASREIRLVIAGENRFGDATDDREIEEALAPIATSVDRPGWMARSEFLEDVDLAVFPSIWREPFGLVAAEAMAAGASFVVSDAGALTEVVGGDHPWVTRAGDATDLAETILRALHTDDDVRELHARLARRRWEERFSPSSGRARVAELLVDLGRRGPATDERSGADR